MAEEAQKRKAAATVRTHEAVATGTDASQAMESAADLTALLADHKSVCIDMRTHWLDLWAPNTSSKRSKKARRPRAEKAARPLCAFTQVRRRACSTQQRGWHVSFSSSTVIAPLTWRDLRRSRGLLMFSTERNWNIILIPMSELMAKSVLPIQIPVGIRQRSLCWPQIR